MQMVCDPAFKITSICCNWPGATHDNRIFKMSSLCHQFERGKRSCSFIIETLTFQTWPYLTRDLLTTLFNWFLRKRNFLKIFLSIFLCKNSTPCGGPPYPRGSWFEQTSVESIQLDASTQINASLAHWFFEKKVF